MDHGSISSSLASRLQILRERIGEADIPSSSLDERINLATWNIREFGRKKRKKDAIHFIAEILSNFDVIAIAELRDDLSDLKRVMDLLGGQWRVVFSDFNSDRAGNRERMAYLYDKRAVVFTGLAAELDPPKKKIDGEYQSTIEWWRSPYMASFRAGDFDFIMISVHIRWGSGEAARVPPLKGTCGMDRQASQRRGRLRPGHHPPRRLQHPGHGESNVPGHHEQGAACSRSPAVGAAHKPGGYARSREAVRPDPPLPQADQVLHRSRWSCRFLRGDFSPLLPELDKSKAPYQLSDHLPLWIQVDVDTAKERLDQIISGGD